MEMKLTVTENLLIGIDGFIIFDDVDGFIAFVVLCIQDSVYANLSLSVAVHDCDRLRIRRAVHAALHPRSCHASHLLRVLF